MEIVAVDTVVGRRDQHPIDRSDVGRQTVIGLLAHDEISAGDPVAVVVIAAEAQSAVRLRMKAGMHLPDVIELDALEEFIAAHVIAVYPCLGRTETHFHAGEDPLVLLDSVEVPFPDGVHLAVYVLEYLVILESLDAAQDDRALVPVVRGLESVVRAEGRAELVVLQGRPVFARASFEGRRQAMSPEGLAVERAGVLLVAEKEDIGGAVGQRRIVDLLGMGGEQLEPEAVAR